MQKHKSLYIDTEALSTLALVQAGLMAPIDRLMNKLEAKEVNETKVYRGVPFPFALVLAPKGKKNHKVLEDLQHDETVDLICEGTKVGEIIVDETFPIDFTKRLHNIYGTSDPSHPGVKNTLSRLGEIAVCGKYHVDYPIIEDNIKRVKEMIKTTNAKFVSSMMITANPLNRAHERMIRQTIAESDLLIIFLRKPFSMGTLRYDIRYNALHAFIDNFIPKNKVLIIPFENTYIFTGVNEIFSDANLAKNYGCHQLVVGKNHGGLGLLYDENRLSTIFDHCKNIDIDIKAVDEYVYCDTCKTLVSTNTCPHGQHHHVHYHSDSIMQLIRSGLLPPPILVRKEVSASISAALFPERFENLQQLHYSLMPGSGLLEKPSDEQFYHKLIELYQTSSLT
ncbi:MAG: sulfate adenylyltransferase [Sulfurovum sp.]|nr:MAG: sulfate adenylyltransferase [Sulfurovum sp.]